MSWMQSWESGEAKQHRTLALLSVHHCFQPLGNLLSIALFLQPKTCANSSNLEQHKGGGSGEYNSQVNKVDKAHTTTHVLNMNNWLPQTTDWDRQGGHYWEKPKEKERAPAGHAVQQDGNRSETGSERTMQSQGHDSTSSPLMIKAHWRLLMRW